MAVTKHLIRSGDHRSGYTAYCGHKQQSDFAMTTYAEANDLCSKCSSKYFTEQVKGSGYHLADRLDLSNDLRRYRYKSIYPIVRDADKAVLGFVAIKSGWGQSWYVYGWEDPNTYRNASDGEFAQPQMSEKQVKYRRQPDDVGEYGGLFSSKEQALFAVPTMVDQNKLPSYDDKLAAATAQFNKLRQSILDDVAQRERAREERTATLQQIREEFGGLLAAGTLTNAQTAALTDAAKLLNIPL